MDKYGKAIQLKGCIDKVRKDYTKKIKQEVRTTPYCTVLVWSYMVTVLYLSF